MRDPMDWMLKKFGDNACGLVLVAVIVVALKIAGVL
jgi:hypothetical protein